MTLAGHALLAPQAAEEFKANGLEGVVVTHRDIEANGFPQELHGQADAVFLDLPGPWTVCGGLLGRGPVAWAGGAGAAGKVQTCSLNSLP